MDIICRGKLPEDRVWQGTCSNCGTVAPWDHWPQFTGQEFLFTFTVKQGVIVKPSGPKDLLMEVKNVEG